MKIAQLLSSVTETGAGNSDQLDLGNYAKTATFQATGIMSAATGTAVVNIEVSNDKVVWLVLGTITLALTTSSSSDGFTTAAPWAYVRANVTTLTANGSVSVTMNV